MSKLKISRARIKRISTYARLDSRNVSTGAFRGKKNRGKKFDNLGERDRHLLAANAVSWSKAEGLHYILVIGVIARIVEVTLGNELIRVGEICTRVICGQMSDRDDRLQNH